MADRTLDRREQFDERSRNYPITAIVPEPIRGRSWYCDAYLDQGSEGACVGFAWTHELAASPVRALGATKGTAQWIYRRAQKIDEWPGEGSGTSVIAGAKVVQEMGHIGEYRWAFGIDDLLRALSHAGPAVLGIPWLDSMFTPRPDGLLDCSGSRSGGHAILARGLLLKWSPRGGGGRTFQVVRLRNSWGPGWGKTGDAFIRVEDLERLLDMRGEACIPVVRTRPAV